ncbi:hypothetical protein SAMN05216474_2365 [Lishizhenia tianjinensis]|uniref:Uncharacterized protein n=1 Tax=Lishizhenia tianjinensis TaxID=477690 RepID=A0A1I7AWV1_9FLAO|nr:hypothetical protein [Lishizhenia tianjinensis]SFT79437.1 hypothetical protein SAMN05216474_2365 [Lishizhenia tianjinensis]
MNTFRKGIIGFNSQSHHSRDEIISFLQQIVFPYFIDFKSLVPPSDSSNFWQVTVSNVKNKVAFDLLINSTYWYLALVEEKGSWMNNKYIDFPEDLLTQLKGVPIDVFPMSNDELNRIFKEEELSALDDIEIEQIKYWKSKTVGEVVFNGYD